jgi:outer membrane receptor protein involved in Fe transport
LLNLRADYDFTDNFSTAVGVTNLLDQNYALADGFPRPAASSTPRRAQSSDGSLARPG